MNYFEQLEAMHQQIREFVEREVPKCKVTEIDGYTTTNYIPPLDTPLAEVEATPFVLIDIKMRFRVDALYLGMRLSCEVLVTINDELLMADRAIRR